MIDQVDQRLLDWAATTSGAGKAFLSAPDDLAEGVSLYLMDLTLETPARGARKPPLSVKLRYLVSVMLKDIQASHRLLWDLMLDAVRRSEKNEWSLDTQSPPLELWTALKAAPRPAFILRVPAWHEWPAAIPAAPVRKPIVIDAQPMTRLNGIVMAHGEPIMGALILMGDSQKPDPDISVAALTAKLIDNVTGNPRTYSDASGRFQFSLAGGPRGPQWLLVRAKGHMQVYEFDSADTAKPLVLDVKLNGDPK